MDYLEYLLELQKIGQQNFWFYIVVMAFFASMAIAIMWFWKEDNKAYKPTKIEISGSKDEVNKLLDMLKHGKD
jgi:hypothetical protein